MIRNSFKKEERLCSKRLIDSLFHSGSSFVVYPFRVVFLKSELPLSSHVQIILSVPKRRFKHAVSRNKIKRKMRECYRLQKNTALAPVASGNSLNLLLALQYVANEELSFQVMFSKMKIALAKIVDEIS
ncbi:ribonuclease P protein component [Sphingobacterium pedocola]|uniref:Ribonuclease P protein component n=1 Tax=Sphingobacterium pedocola TaxID=2082722 RepID=A0ABR9T4C6_9SPHI|nr:ribonuclease P protein component [Sphingobacterium pedocola]MBE8719512.1 ribonuclease P protein component [Sphingobacterium pedocola]